MNSWPVGIDMEQVTADLLRDGVSLSGVRQVESWAEQKAISLSAARRRRIPRIVVPTP
jgi:hypothetical protein